MANESVNDTDSGVASSEVTPVNQESSSLTPPTATPPPPSEMEQVTTPGAAASSEREEVEKVLTQMMPSKPTEDDSDDDIDETLGERLMGLSEMFPETLRSASCSLVHNTFKLMANSYWLSRQIVWGVATTSLLLFAPVLFEVERLNTEEAIKQDRNKLVLGPGTAMAGAPVSMMPPVQ